MQRKNTISDGAILKATGKTIAEWVKVIDKFGGDKMTHKEIARKLYEEGLIKSGWYCQSVTVEYEYAKGRRVVGETVDSGFEIGVQKVLPVPQAKLWDKIISGDLKKIWLGDVPLKLKKNYKFKTKDGTSGEIRTFDPPNKLRLTYQPKGRKSPTTLQLYLECHRNKPDQTHLSFHQEKLSNAAEREKMRKHWKAVISRIDAYAQKSTD